jgi:hypothetical protein
MRKKRAIKDWAGHRFGRLVAVNLVERRSDRNHVWRFACDCGGEKQIKIKQVRSGKTASCGCLQREALVARNKRHGRSGTPTHRTWKDMRARCNNPSNSDYRDYGGRGIRVCDRWDDFSAFLKDMGERPDGKTLDRVDVDGNYEPGNCRWATPNEQAQNRRNNLIVEFDGEPKVFSQICREQGVDRTKARYRFDAGYSLDQVFCPKSDFRK